MIVLPAAGALPRLLRSGRLSAQGLRFLGVGGVTTAASFGIFVALDAAGLHYLLASVIAWAATLVLSYGLNKVVTFRQPSRAEPREFAAFTAGAVLQLGLASVGYAVLMGVFGLAAAPAFAVNLALTASFSFAFMRLVVFVRPSQGSRATVTNSL
ncbi:MAG TPA: GtrA family protein [Beijerinckiaceae bacterium]